MGSHSSKPRCRISQPGHRPSRNHTRQHRSQLQLSHHRLHLRISHPLMPLALRQCRQLSLTCQSRHTQHQNLSAQQCRIHPQASRRIARRRRISKLLRPMLALIKINQTHTHLSNLPRYTSSLQWMTRRVTKHLLPSHSLCRESITHSSLCQWHCPPLFRMIRSYPMP